VLKGYITSFILHYITQQLAIELYYMVQNVYVAALETYVYYTLKAFFDQGGGIAGLDTCHHTAHPSVWHHPKCTWERHVQGKPNAIKHFYGHKGNTTLTVWLIYDFGRWSLKPMDSAKIVTNVHDVAACEYVKITHPPVYVTLAQHTLMPLPCRQ